MASSKTTNDETYPDVPAGQWAFYKKLANGWEMWTMLMTTGKRYFKSFKRAS